MGETTTRLATFLDSIKKYLSYEMVIVLATQAATVGLFLGGLASPLTTAVVIIPLSILMLMFKKQRQLSQESAGRAVALVERLEGLLDQFGRVAVSKGAIDLLDKVTFDSASSVKASLEIAGGIRTQQSVISRWHSTLREEVGLLRRATASEQKYTVQYYLSQAVNDLILLYEQYVDTICTPAIRLVNASFTRDPQISETFNLFRQNMWELRGAINPFLVDCRKAELNPKTVEVKALTSELEPYKSPNPFG